MTRKKKRQANGAEEKFALTAAPPATPVGALKLKPAAAHIAVSPVTLYRLVARGLIRPCRQTRHLIFSIKELNRFLEDGME
jgi:hypothetical protein